MKTIVVEKLYKQIVTVQCDSEEKALRTAMARTVANPKNDVLVSIKADMIEMEGGLTVRLADGEAACRNIGSDEEYFTCGACGWTSRNEVADGRGRIERLSFCPHCGKPRIDDGAPGDPMHAVR